MAATKAKINQPTPQEYEGVMNTLKAYDRQVRWLLSPKGSISKAYEELARSDSQLQEQIVSLERLASLAANNQTLLMKDAARMAMLKGPPPPEPQAQAPLIGKAREPFRPAAERGRMALRIDRRTV